MKLKQTINDLRDEIGTVDQKVVDLRKHIAGLGVEDEAEKALPPEADAGEMIANVTLAHRHLEDGRMRLGKAIQALEGGQSIYDSQRKDPAPTP